MENTDPKNDIQGILDKSWVFKNFSEEERDAVIQNSSLVQYHNKDTLFRQHTRTSHVMYVVSGLVKIYKENGTNRSVTLKIISGNQFVGLDNIYAESEYQYSGTAIVDTMVLIIDFGTFNHLVLSNGRFALDLIRILSRDSLYIFTRLNSQTHKQLPGRIADVLLYFSEEIFHSYSFEFPLTRHELAELAGTTKESFIRTINEFKHDKIIQMDGRKVEIKSLDVVKILSELG
ncbi:MAG TPA: Crp/Fnr family transcriptional regulator [Bacteroidetes bacterium]|nr:Crp/Fnr family transcriptional regulator [Bacteroidota bacterium]